jgi:serine-type D-Ala-D-Ala carboxypeptidase/endopeptidase
MPDLDAALRSLDDRFARLQAEARIPGVAWGVVLEGELVHAGGAGTIRHGEERRPDADSVYRIASMTKSFTASAVLLLRDEGRLRLDDPVATYVPELAGWRPPTRDSGPITVRQLLTMSAGLPTDDPWGDRQQGLPLDRFAELLAAGPSFAWPPGTTFDYSNLGYGILGRVITNVAGSEYREVVRDRLLAPLGMTSTAYLETDVDERHIAHGYARRGEDELLREGTDGYGALASMGGVFSSVRDLARWVSGFLDAFPARDDHEGPHPVRRATRREMQQVQRAYGPVVAAHGPDADPVVTAGGYGLGLFVLQDPELGTTISHAGGYPGFGSHMAWHPVTGLGVIGLGNLRYAPVRPVVADALTALLRADVAPRRRLAVVPRVAAFRPVIEALLAHWDDAVAGDAFAMNMDLDEPREERRDAIARIFADLGPLRPDDTRPPSSDSPADLTWWLRGERGWVRVSILVTPEPVPRIQRLALRAVGDPSPKLRALAERVLALARVPEPAWPGDLALAPDVDRDALLRALRAADPRFGRMALGHPMEGDGVAASTFELVTERGTAELVVALDPATGLVTAVALRVRSREAPAEAW